MSGVGVRGRGGVWRTQAAAGSSCGGGDPLLLRVARGEKAERTPVWLLRQAGRYMKEFRKYSDVLPFRERSETADIAVELSLQPWRAYKPDGVIMFSDILTPLPALGVDFDVVKGRGPVISNTVRSMDDVVSLRPMLAPDETLPFVGEILSTLRKEVNGEATVIGFVGTPWTLAAYSVEGGANRYCKETKTMMFNEPQILHALLDHVAEALVEYCSYQIESGAQVMQLFDSWAHHLTPEQFQVFSLDYVEKVITKLRARHPETPILFYVNGCGGKLEMLRSCTADVIGIDWGVSVAEAREVLGGRTIQGNVDPMVLFGKQETIEEAVDLCIKEGGGQGHILNVGNGVIQGTPEDAVKILIDRVKEHSSVVSSV
ncbi:uroporphyrinogen decarboxylase [Chloropicon primus]|uniref:Uroporphyrinogen decarboxylase n=2 Tax=Chloropicon primus TaxID=1764295 RepID=A0A5B8MEA6_9CHLO|nr:uroporphyrinogen decarboxylase [Chloropicon primus]UPQ97970.1 uroporphyrinogen decarboxylase [Chloropicon primus]|eukprot:QDZ18763.1 uroporphyrinogen decarboxylase [Chloropicon primus]